MFKVDNIEFSVGKGSLISVTCDKNPILKEHGKISIDLSGFEKETTFLNPPLKDKRQHIDLKIVLDSDDYPFGPENYLYRVALENIEDGCIHFFKVIKIL